MFSKPGNWLIGLGLALSCSALLASPGRTDEPAMIAVATEKNAVDDFESLLTQDPAPGTSVKLGLIHQGQEKTVILTLGTMPNDKQAANAPQTQHEVPDSDLPKLGLSLAPASKVSGADAAGVVVTAVAAGGVAADQGLQVGDIILDVGGKPVSTPADIRPSLRR